MEFGILGPLEVVEDVTQVDLGGAKQRALLAVLLLHANEIVSTDRIIDALWEDANGALDNEEGCLRFDVTVDSTDPNRFMLYEVYRNAEARQIHRAAPYLKRVGAGLDTWLVEPAKMVVATPV